MLSLTEECNAKKVRKVLERIARSRTRHRIKPLNGQHLLKGNEREMKFINDNKLIQAKRTVPLTKANTGKGYFIITLTSAGRALLQGKFLSVFSTAKNPIT